MTKALFLATFKFSKPIQMVFFKLAARFILISLLMLGLAEVGYSQGCNGDGGTGITGGAISTNPGFLCANLDALGGPGSRAEITITAGTMAINRVKMRRTHG